MDNVEAEPPLETPPWDLLLTFTDSQLENAYWSQRVKNLLLHTDRAINALGVISFSVLLSRIEHLDFFTFLLGALSIVIPAALIICSFAPGETYVQWRSCLLVPEKISMVTISGILKARIPALCGIGIHKVFPLLVHSNGFALVILTLGLQSKFRTHVLLQLVVAGLATQFSPMYCKTSHDACGVDSVFGPLATRIDNLLWMLMTVQPSPPDIAHLNGEAGCKFTLMCYQWGVSLVAGSLLHNFEAYSRVIFLLSRKRHSSQNRQFLWKSWRHAVLISIWNCVVGLTIVVAIIKMFVLGVLDASICIT